jgi:hypothetical protein
VTSQINTNYDYKFSTCSHQYNLKNNFLKINLDLSVDIATIAHRKSTPESGLHIRWADFTVSPEAADDDGQLVILFKI